MHRETVTDRVVEEKQRLKLSILAEDTLDQSSQLAAGGSSSLRVSTSVTHIIKGEILLETEVPWRSSFFLPWPLSTVMHESVERCQSDVY